MDDSPYSPTSASLLIAAVRRHGRRIALTVDGRDYAYAELDALSDRVAAYLLARGLARGARIALHLRNGAEYAISDLAILKLAAIRVPLNELMGREELAWCLRHADAQALISHASLPQPLVGEGERLAPLRISVPDRETCRPGEIPWAEVIGARGLDAVIEADPVDTAILAYTGGTTGHPKAVRHTYGRMASNLFAHIVSGDIRSDEVMLLTTPLPHSAGFHMAGCLLQGGQVILSTRFDPVDFLKVCQDQGVTWTFAVPTMLYRLLDAMAEDGPAIPTLRTVVYGAAPMSRPRLEQALARLGPVFIQIYGQTECPNFITTLSKDDHLDPKLLTSCGRAVPFTRVRIAGTDAVEGVGEVEVSAPYLLAEYFRNPEATAASLDGGWLRTGDLGYLADGYLFLVDRAKDMIITGGMNVYCSEVEAVLRRHEAVADVAVVGLPDADWGEIVTAVVVPGQATDPETLRLFARTHLSGYKAPKRVVLAEALPLTPYGKIDKKRLRHDLEAARDIAVGWPRP